MVFIVERIAEDFVILELEDRSHIHLPREQFPAQLREGDLLRKTASGYMIDTEATKKRREQLAMKTRKLFGENS